MEGLTNSNSITQTEMIGNKELLDISPDVLATETYNENTPNEGAGVLQKYGTDTSPIGGSIKSPNYVDDVSGWKLDSNGNIYTKSFSIVGGAVVGSFSPYSTTFADNGDLGDSTHLWDNIWCDELHYNTLTAISDETLKKDIKNITAGLKELNKLRPVEFKWKKDNKGNWGFIAQEVQKVLPFMVSNVTEVTAKRDKRTNKLIKKETSTGLLEIEISKLFPVMVKAIQELTARVEALEKK